MSFYLTTTDTTITFHVTAIDGRDRYRLFWRLATETEANAYTIDTTDDFTYTVTGLTPETEYVTNVIHWDLSVSTTEYEMMGAQSVTTDALISVRPSEWIWPGIAIGSSIPTYDGNLAPVTADDWNSFCFRINEFRLYKAMTEYAFNPVSQGEGLSAAPVRQAISAISGISGAGSTPTAIEPLKASFWLQLASALNAVD